MGRRAARRNRGAGKPPLTPAPAQRPQVHVRLALASFEAPHVAELIKPAILYADKVTIYSPLATLLHNVDQFTSITDPALQMTVLLDMMEQVPTGSFDLPGELDPATTRQMRALLQAPREFMLSAGREAGIGDQLDELYETMDRFGEQWSSEFPRAMETAVTDLNAEELMVAIKRGGVEVAESRRMKRARSPSRPPFAPHLARATQRTPIGSSRLSPLA